MTELSTCKTDRQTDRQMAFQEYSNVIGPLLFCSVIFNLQIGPMVAVAIVCTSERIFTCG